MNQTTVRAPKREQREARNLKLAQGFAPRDDELLLRLKALRMKLAKTRGVAAFVIFADKSLIDMATKKPLTKFDFGQVHGVGAAKLEQFGGIFLKEIASFIEGA